MKIRKYLLALTLISSLFAAVSARGTVYVTNFGDGTVSSVPDTGGAATTFATGLNDPMGITITPSGTIYVGNFLSGVIDTVSATGTVTPFAAIPPTRFVAGLTHDAAGNIYTTIANDGRSNGVIKITPSGAMSTYATGLANPQGLAFDSAGDLFVASYSTEEIDKVAPGGGAATRFASLLTPTGIAVDALGNVYASSESGGFVAKFSPLGASLGTYGMVASPRGLLFDNSGNLLVASSTESGSGSTVFEIPPGGGTVSTFATGFAGPTYIAIMPAATGVPPPARSLRCTHLPSRRLPVPPDA